MQRKIAIGKIRKLLLTAADKRTPENERTNARSIANKMMKQYGVNEMEVWGTTRIEDIPEDIQNDFVNGVYAKVDDFIAMLETKQDEAIEGALNKAEKYVEENKAGFKKKFGDWVDGLFK